MHLISKNTSKIEFNFEEVKNLLRELHKLDIVTKVGSLDCPNLFKLYTTLQDAKSELTEDDYK